MSPALEEYLEHHSKRLKRYSNYNKILVYIRAALELRDNPSFRNINVIFMAAPLQ